MATTNDGRSESVNEARPTRAGAAPAEARDSPRPPQADATARPDHQAADPATADPPSDTPPPAAGAPARPGRKWLLRAGVVVGLAAGGYSLIPYVKTMLNTVSTDDAYVNGHVTFVASRVSGLVSRVLVDDNYRVKKGALLVQLDKEPYQVQVDLKKAAVVNTEADLEVARSEVRALWPWPGASGGSSRGRWRTSTTRSRSSGPGSRPCGARRRPSNAPGRISPAPRASSAATRCPARTSTSGSRPSGGPQPRPTSFFGPG